MRPLDYFIPLEEEEEIFKARPRAQGARRAQRGAARRAWGSRLVVFVLRWAKKPRRIFDQGVANGPLRGLVS